VYLTTIPINTANQHHFLIHTNSVKQNFFPIGVTVTIFAFTIGLVIHETNNAKTRIIGIGFMEQGLYG
jgi:hypothetical protein